MHPPSESLLQQVLATDQTHAWLEQFTDAFFDPDAKRAVLDAIRADLAALVPAYGCEPVAAAPPPHKLPAW